MDAFAEGAVADAETSRVALLSDSPLEKASNYTVASLATALKRYSDRDRSAKNPLSPAEKRDFEKAQNNYKLVVEDRVRKLSPEYGDVVAKYVSDNLRLGSVSTIGHALESLSSVPMLLHQLESSGGTNITESATAGIEGLSWTGKDGEKYTFGKMSYALNGTVDYMVIKDSGKSVDIFPAEGKMESSGGKIPHHGNSDNFNRFVTQMWKNNKGKININPTMVLNLPNGSKDHSVTLHELSMNYSVEEIQEPGRTFGHGRLVTATELQRRSVR
jgi:hypothetical protein